MTEILDLPRLQSLSPHRDLTPSPQFKCKYIDQVRKSFQFTLFVVFKLNKEENGADNVILKTPCLLHISFTAEKYIFWIISLAAKCIKSVAQLF